MIFTIFFANRKEVTDKESRLVRGLRPERVAPSGQQEMNLPISVSHFPFLIMVRRIGRTRRCESAPKGLKALTALVVLRHKVIQPLLAAATQTQAARGAQNPRRIDQYYETLRAGMQGLFHELGLAA